MIHHHVTQTATLPVGIEEAFAWHRRPGAFRRLTPPWQTVRVLEQRGTIEEGDWLKMRMHFGPFTVQWDALHDRFQPPHEFRDVQQRGPFAKWIHRHRFEQGSNSQTRLIDDIEYALPGGRLGNALGSTPARRALERLFRYRHAVTRDDLEMHAAHASQRRLTVAVSGAGGLIGSSLSALLTTGGHRVVRLVRTESGEDANRVLRDTQHGLVEPRKFDAAEIDAVVHLAGENVASGRWTKRKMARIRNSRVEGTRSLVRSLLQLDHVPTTLITASAIGFYGDRGDERLDELSTPGDGFLSEVCRDWEAATQPATDAGMRVVNARIGVVLTPAGGVLAKMLTPFRLGLGGQLGRGDQYMSWISLDDAIAALHHLLMRESISGPVNLVAPHAVTNAQFTKVLGRVLGRPTLLPMPGLAVRAAFGRMGRNLILASTRVTPRRLAESDYRFRHATVEAALSHVLGIESGEITR